jgi:hypothetical protein
VRNEGNKHRWTFVREQQCVSDVLALSSDPRTLKNNERHWTFVHEGQGAPDTLVSSSDPNASQRMHYNPSYSRQTAVSSKSRRFPSKLHHHHLEALRQCPTDAAHEKRSNMNVDPRMNLRCSLELPLDRGKTLEFPSPATKAPDHKRRPERDCERVRVHDTLRKTCERCIHHSPAWPRCRRGSQFRILACGRGATSNGETRHRAHLCQREGTVFGKPLHSRLDVVALSAEPKEQQYCCSVSKSVSERWTVHPALSPHVQMTDSPVVQNSTRPKTRSNPPYGH